MKQVKISEVLSMLENGKTREEIKDFYQLSPKELKLLFQHSKLKGKKTRKKPSLEIIDDTEDSINISERNVIGIKSSLNPQRGEMNLENKSDEDILNDLFK